ncbi:MAG: hypothetical protein QOF96_1414, partial [Actinomycetota bacterium]|nr:hypothetical protein [Actinomycetota bacterium]
MTATTPTTMAPTPPLAGPPEAPEVVTP